MIKPGLRAHDFGRSAAEDLAASISLFGPACIQLAPWKALADAPSDAADFVPDFARTARKAFARRGISVSVLGCYINPVHPDKTERERQLSAFERHIEAAALFGCGIVGTETGSRNPDCSYHPDTCSPETFRLLSSSVERLVLKAEKCGACVGIEPVAGRHTLSSIEKTAELLRLIDSPALRIIFDPVNLIPENGLEEDQETFFGHALDVFGDRLAVLHAKDFVMLGGRKKGDLPAGTGCLDYRALMRLIAGLNRDIDVLLENTSPGTARAALDFVAGAAVSEGITVLGPDLAY